MAALVANPHLKTLTMVGDIGVDGGAQLAAAPGIKVLSLGIVSAQETVETVQSAWVAAGKSLVELTVVVRKA